MQRGRAQNLASGKSARLDRFLKKSGVLGELNT
jgi:hypothetical protein